MKDVVNSYWGQEQAAEVADNVNIVSDGKSLIDETSAIIDANTAETQTLKEES